MAKNQVEIRIPTKSITVVSSQHTVFKYDHCVYAYTVPDESYDMTEESIFSIPFELPNSCSLTYLKFPMTYRLDHPSTDSLTLTLIVDGIEYSLGSDGNPTDNSIITHMNEYKAQHGQLPSISLKMVSFMVSESTLDPDASVEIDSRATSIMLYNPIVGCTIKGSQSINRPTSDVSQGHTIYGAATVYQALNEEVADDDATYIQTHSGSSTSVSETSVIGILLPAPTKSLLKYLYLNVREKFGNTNISVTESFNFTLSLGSYSSSCVVQYNSLISEEAGTTWFNYNIAFNEDDAIVSAINSHIQLYGTTPDIQVTITSVAKGNSDKGSIIADVYLTQLYLDAIFEEITGLSIHRKVNGAWVQAQSAYQKQNGAWVEITEDECKTLLSQSLCGQGQV